MSISICVKYMRLDEFTHKHPLIYNRKRDVINHIKYNIYKFIGVWPRVAKIKAKKERVYAQYCGHNKILDVGCGRGDFLERICLQYGSQGVGIDISAEMLLFAKTKHPNQKFILGNANQLPFKDKSFDIVILNGVFHHLPPGMIQATLEEAWLRGINFLYVYR